MSSDRNFLDELGLSGDYGAESGGFSLESILAEYKGSAFMDGDRKTPPAELQEKTDEIIREIMERDPASNGSGSAPASPARGAPDMPVKDIGSFFDNGEFADMSDRRRSQARQGRSAVEPEREKPVSTYDGPDEEPEIVDMRKRVRSKREKAGKKPPRRAGRETPSAGADSGKPQRRAAEERPSRHPERRYDDEAAEPAYETAPEIDLSAFEEPEKPAAPARDGLDEFLLSLGEDSFDTPVNLGRTPKREQGTEPSADVAETEERGERELRGDRRAARRGLFGRPGRPEPPYDEPEEPYYDDEDVEEPDREEYDDYLDVEPDPDFKKTAAKYARRVPALRFRIIGASIIVILMVVETWLFSAGKATPLIGAGARGNTASLLIMELLVMAVGMEVIIRGLEDILTFSPGAESLVFVSCVCSVIDGFAALITGSYSRGLPMAVVSAISLLGALSARKSMYMAYCDCLKGASSSSSFYGVAADMEGMEDRRILKKVTGEREGFYTKLTSPDMSESLYDDIAPLLVIVSFALALAASVGRGEPGAFTHTFSVLTAVSAAFPATVLFALPFRYVASAVKKSGGALAGYAGAKDIAASDGALITDLDIFPLGSIRLDGAKMFEGVDQRKALSSSASLVISSDSGLRRVFEELLKSQGLTRRRVDDFSCYEGGGIGGLVDGERVLVGTGAFMNLMGIRVPDKMNVAGNVFTAINDELVCVYTLSYTPSSSVQSALVSLLGTNTNVLMAVRDFNVTPNTVRQKFKVSMDGVEYLPVDTTYALSQNQIPDGCDGISAVLCRGGLAPFAEVITRGRLLKLITGLNTALTVFGTALSIVIMFFLCWSGAFAAANAMNITVFMSVIAIAVYIISQGARKRIK